MTILIGSDHAGFSEKLILMAAIRALGHEVTDTGAHEFVADDDYPDFAATMAIALSGNKGDRGILICGSAVGVSVAANKFKGIRAGICHDTYSAHQAVEHDNINILCLGARVIGIELAKEIVFTYLNATYQQDARFRRRLDKIAALEDKNMK